ncbi:MAG: flagellar basal-body MS-ring/collar protein FliF [Clostridium sp.]|uniref:flagellar basal-body MS-ring/collar protein FliF n=1 Tax=Clostridium sp. TaxID=1506 RepID=UPI003043ED82
MNKLSELMKKLKDKWNAMSKKKRVALSIIIVVAILAIGILLYISLVPKYTVLFSNMDSQDSGRIIENLNGKGVKYKIEGKSILVEKSQVDKLRMEMLSEVKITEGSQGFEIFDEGKIAPTDEESRIMYQRAISGELERTIKSFEEVEAVKVNLVLPNNSAFITKPSPASASVTLKLVPGSELSQEQVKAIVYLVTGSVENLDKESVTIVSDNLTLLTEGLFDKDGGSQSASTEKQIASTRKLEKEYESKILNVLEPIYKDNVKVSVNTELNFDAVKQNNVIYDKDKNVIVSEHTIKDTLGDEGNTSGSTVDNNMNNTQGEETATTGNGRFEETKNYNNSKTEETVVKAPGQLDRVTVSVVINGELDNITKSTVKNLVADAIGYSEARGDGISVEGLNFNEDYKSQAEKEIEAMKAAELKAKRNKLIALTVGAVVGLILIIVTILMVRSKKVKDEEEDEEAVDRLDVTIGNQQLETAADLYKSLNLDVETEKEKVMKEVKKYAEKKPEQVAEIIKSWLNEEERR